ncbi:MAG TPA: Lrp/AsnC family transcriptional regulator [Candidatus Thermoplasmatota archaeon]|jgi:Lrp/AsnC family leucine-responsive transcriptional regulator|nr:Lrp/AsnC family transcriptional regulator [Candidatus Thermoplasmatota archaeon]
MPRGNGSIDDLDRKILAVLAFDGRATLQAIGDRVGLRRPAVHERLRRLERAGVVQGYRADLDPAAVGAEVAAFVLLRIEGTGRDGNDCLACCDRVARALRKLPGVLEFHTLAGSEDAVVKVRAADVRALERLVMRDISGIPGVARVNTMVVLSTHFERPLALPPPDAKPGRRRA